MENKIKEKIMSRLYDYCSRCAVCKKQSCKDHGSRELPFQLLRDQVLKAINLDEYFMKEDQPTKTPEEDLEKFNQKFKEYKSQVEKNGSKVTESERIAAQWAWTAKTQNKK